MPRITRTTDKVTADHIRNLAARTSTSRVLAYTTSGVALVHVDTVLAEGSNVIRVLLTRDALIDGRSARRLTMTEYLDTEATNIAADINRLLGSDGSEPA